MVALALALVVSMGTVALGNTDTKDGSVLWQVEAATVAIEVDALNLGILERGKTYEGYGEDWSDPALTAWNIGNVDVDVTAVTTNLVSTGGDYYDIPGTPGFVITQEPLTGNTLTVGEEPVIVLKFTIAVPQNFAGGGATDYTFTVTVTATYTP